MGGLFFSDERLLRLYVVGRAATAMPSQLLEVPAAERAPIVERYVERCAGGRPRIPVDRTAPVTAFEAVADRYPVSRVVPAPSGQCCADGRLEGAAPRVGKRERGTGIR